MTCRGGSGSIGGMGMRKTMKIEVPPGVMDDVPEGEREGLMEQLRELFTNFDPENPPGEPVQELPPGATTCPACGSALTAGPTVPLDGAVLLIYDCSSCDRVFSREAD